MKHFSKILVLSAILFFNNCFYSQVNQQWVSSYNGIENNYDETKSIAVDALGNVYVTGNSYSSATNDDYVTIKYNPSGIQQWIALYNGPADSIDNASSVCVDASGNVYVTGYSIGSGLNYDCLTIKYNPSGTLIWTARYNGPGNDLDFAGSVYVDGSSNVYITGFGYGSGNNNLDYMTIKYDSSGNQKWVATYNGSLNYNDRAYSLTFDVSGNVYVTGSGNADCITIKYNSSGIQQWIAMFNGQANFGDYGQKVAIDNLGNVYVAGQTQVTGNNKDYLAIKYNSHGVQQWASTFSGSQDDQAYSMVIDASGNMVITGRSYGYPNDYDYLTVKFNSSGVMQWSQRYNGNGNRIDIAYSIALDLSGNTYVTGYCDETGTSNYDIVTIKYSKSGIQQWVQKYNGTANGRDWAGDITVVANGDIFVTGYSAGNGTLYDCTTIKYSQSLTGIHPISSEIPSQYSLSQNYPNPFNPSTKIKFDIPSTPLSFGEGQGVGLFIYNSLGQQITTLINQQLTPGTYEVEWNATNYPSGIYFYRLSSSEFTQTNKMVLIK